MGYLRGKNISMKVYCIYFSPTGTSASVAKAVAHSITETPEDVVICDMTRDAAKVIMTPDDVAVIAAPVYGGKMAPIAKARMSEVMGDDTPCAIIAVYGNRAFEGAVNDMAAAARDMGCVPVAAAAFVGEHTYSRPDTPIAMGRPDADDLQQARIFGREVAAKLSSGDRSEADIAELRDIPSPDESLANFRSFVAGYQKRQAESPVRLLPVRNDTLCDRCGICVSVCPTRAMSLSGIDAAACIKCSACVKRCPTSALSLVSPFAPVLSRNFSARKQPVWTV